MKYFLVIFWGLTFGWSIGYAHEKEVLGIKIPAEITFDTKEKVKLNGYGIAVSWGEKWYVAALYAEKKETYPNNFLLKNQPMAMVFYFIQDDISPQMLTEEFIEGILMNNEGLDTPFEEKRLTELQNAIKKTLHAGDVLAFYYSPNNGLSLLINGKVEQHWSHAKTLFNAILSMWIGKYPPSREFKQTLLLND